jgi:hypothetical protein
MCKDFIDLSQEIPIASGNNRIVFKHPYAPDLIIKIVKMELIRKREGEGSSWTKARFRRYRIYTNYLRECQEHIVSRLESGGVPSFMQRFVGFVDTDQGLGLVTFAEKDASGNYAKTLVHLIENDSFDEIARKALDDFIQEFYKSKVIVTDLSAKNLVYSYRDINKPQFVLIDGYGEKNLIPFNSFCSWCHQRSKTKRVNRFFKALSKLINRKTLTDISLK